MSVASQATTSAGACAHCGTAMEPGTGRFCCAGCETANGIITGAGLTDFYALRGGPGSGPPRRPTLERTAERAWLEGVAERVAATDALVTVDVGIAGLSCAACVWLIERALLRHDGVCEVVINPARARAALTVSTDAPILEMAAELEALGYRLVPPAADVAVADDGGLLARTGIAAALALNSMMLAAAIYLGLESGWLRDLFVAVGALLAVGSVIVGGGYFGRRALAAIRARAVSLDVPIALGIAAVFASSCWAALTGRESGIYFDTLSVFVALMLAGRLLQERILRRNRQRIAAADCGVDLTARVIRDGRPVAVSAANLLCGDVVLVAPGEVVPSDIRLIDPRAGVRLDWITGESEPRLVRQDEIIAAGAANASRQAFRGEVVRALADTPLPALLATPIDAGATGAAATSRRVAAVYLTLVIAAATIGFAAWALVTGDIPRALEVAAAVLVVTCPCALGIGAPLAFELVASRLAAAGAFVRTATALPRLARVRQVAFDKTGTVTEASLEIADPAVFDALTERERHILFNLAARSAHPRSAVIAEALGGVLDPAIEASEEPGQGVGATVDGVVYRLGRARWASNAASTESDRRDTVFAADGAVRCQPTIIERLRPDATDELAALAADGYRTALVSGDRADRVDAVAARLDGLDDGRVLGAMRPDDKAAWVEANDAGDLLFVGDGLNDAPALERATVSATPSFESPLVAGRVDMYFTGRGLRPIRLALEAARLLARTLRAQLGFVIGYNALVVSVALAGWMQPWLAAVLMPASSLAITTATAVAIKRGVSWGS